MIRLMSLEYGILLVSTDTKKTNSLALFLTTNFNTWLLDHSSPAYNVKTSIIGGFLLKGYIEERAVEIANYIIDNNATVRQTAKQFGISKSTVHKDVTERLNQINPALANNARKVLDLNKSERHIRGGLATKEKYLQKTKYNKAY